MRESWFGWYVIRVLQQTGMDWFQVCCCEWFGVMIELRFLLYTSMERMGSCRVISILEYVFLPMTDTTTSVFHDSSSISKNERDKRGVHLPSSHRLIKTNTSILSAVPHSTSISFPCSDQLFLHIQWTTVSQTIRWITNQRDGHSKWSTHTDSRWYW